MHHLVSCNAVGIEHDLAKETGNRPVPGIVRTGIPGQVLGSGGEEQQGRDYRRLRSMNNY